MTRSDLIDVSEVPAPLAGADAAERVRDYETQVAQVQIRSETSLVFLVPSASRSNTAALLSLPATTGNDREGCAARLARAVQSLSGMAVEDKGPVVVQFPGAA